jgi:hypothetical protein
MNRMQGCSLLARLHTAATSLLLSPYHLLRMVEDLSRMKQALHSLARAFASIVLPAK